MLVAGPAVAITLGPEVGAVVFDGLVVVVCAIAGDARMAQANSADAIVVGAIVENFM